MRNKALAIINSSVKWFCCPECKMQPPCVSKEELIRLENIGSGTCVGAMPGGKCEHPMKSYNMIVRRQGNCTEYQFIEVDEPDYTREFPAMPSEAFESSRVDNPKWSTSIEPPPPITNCQAGTLDRKTAYKAMAPLIEDPDMRAAMIDAMFGPVKQDEDQ